MKLETITELEILKAARHTILHRWLSYMEQMDEAMETGKPWRIYAQLQDKTNRQLEEIEAKINEMEAKEELPTR